MRRRCLAERDLHMHRRHVVRVRVVSCSPTSLQLSLYCFHDARYVNLSVLRV